MKPTKTQPSSSQLEQISTSAEELEDTQGANMYAEELKLIKAIPQPDPLEISKREVILGPKTKKYTLVLDLDETLVRSLELVAEDVGTEEEAEAEAKSEFAFQVRPYARELLAQLKNTYELVLFTAGEEEYAQKAVAVLDPEHNKFSKVLSRQFCVPLKDGKLVKDLRVFKDRSLHEILIVDNNVFSFAFQVGNGIPVTSYAGSKEDDELLCLIDYLEELALESDIVAANAARMGLTCPDLSANA